MKSTYIFLIIFVIFSLLFTIYLTTFYHAKKEKKISKTPKLFKEKVQNVENQKNETKTIKKVENIEIKAPKNVETSKWITFIVPTLSRKQNYLTQTYQSLSEELPIETDPLYGLIKVILFNHNKNGNIHEELNQLTIREPFQKVQGNPTQTTSRVEQQQSLDIIFMLKYVISNVKTKLVVLLEDDFLMCKNSFLALQYFIKKSTKWNPNWIALRVSYGMNGIIFKYDDLNSFISYLENNYKNGKPPDHLFYEFCMNSGRKIMTYRSNLYYHIGKISNFPARPARYSPECYQVSYDWLQEHERFRNEDCPNEDISPCNFNQKSEILVDFDLEARDLCRKHFPLCWNPSIKTLEDSKNNHCRLRI